MHPQTGPSGTLHCKCRACCRWKLYVKGELPGGPTWRQYEVWTQCYIQTLAAYLRHARHSCMLCSSSDRVLTPCCMPAPDFDFMYLPVCRRRAAELGLPSLKVLEVGGGDGRLTAHLKEALGNTCKGPQIGFICTDSGRGGLHLSSPFRCALHLPHLHGPSYL